MRNRKRYCCYYCNTLFYQVDSWQRHNRKHTGVEIECEDCGHMCADHFELKSHQMKCEGYRVYSDEAAPLLHNHKSPDVPTPPEETVTHETPDSTSKQESLPDDEPKQPEELDELEKPPEDCCGAETDDEREKESREEKGDVDVDSTKVDDELTTEESLKNNSNTQNTHHNNIKDDTCCDIQHNNDNTTTSELDDLIGEDKDEGEEETDPDTEALIGVDENEEREMQKEAASGGEKEPMDSSIGVDTQIVMKVEGSFSVEGKPNEPNFENKERRGSGIEWPSFYNRPSPVGAVIDPSLQTINLENGEMNKKYQPYFCKNCGARFTRKDSVTRHLKKGTCSGKSAIVCNICGKVFAEMFELQDHFKMDHKNIVFSPSVMHRSILPRGGETPELGGPPYGTPYGPTHYVVHDQHLVPVSRPYLHPDAPSYRPMPPGLQSMFYGSPHTPPRPSYPPGPPPPPPPPPPGSHFHDPHYKPSGAIELKYSPNSCASKMVLQRAEEISRKREFPREHPMPRVVSPYELNMEPSFRKNRKLDLDAPPPPPPSSKPPHDTIHHGPPPLSSKSPVPHQNINLSEYTNNVMREKQYYDRYSDRKNEPASGKDEAPRSHQCKVCGLEFPRFEYLLTHLRKHKEKDVDRSELLLQEEKEKTEKEITVHVPKEDPERRFPTSTTSTNGETFPTTTTRFSDSSSTSSDDGNDTSQKPSFVVSSQPSEKSPPVYTTTHEPVPMVVQPPQHGGDPHHPTAVNDRYHEQTGVYIPPHALGGEGMEALAPGVDGKFRPFICENCGQRFTRKDSLVRHAKKQTCFEEITDLKCKHCDKTFRYHKCLLQHQELVHGITPDEKHSDDEGSESDKSYKNEMDEERQSGDERKYMPPGGSPDGDHIKHRSKPDYYEHPYGPLPPHMARVLPPRHIPREHHPSDPMTSPRPELPSHRDSAMTMIRDPPLEIHLRERNEKRDDHTGGPRIGDTPLPQEHGIPRHPPTNYPPTFVSPMKEEKFADKFKPVEASPGTGSNNTESQYIGYCMLPRPFQCEYCGDRFAHRHSLKRHVRRHLGIGIPCHDCGKLYRDQSEWRRHQRSIHNRHYEKYEVPSRMSFRDGVEQGLIGIVPNSEHDENNPDHDNYDSGSEKSEDEMSMAKPRQYDTSMVHVDVVTPRDNNNNTNTNNYNNHDKTVDSEDGTRMEDSVGEGEEFLVVTDEKPEHEQQQEHHLNNKEEKIKAFDFKSHTSGDKDTRKSVLDLYLCSPN